jgi:putative endonuclease
LAKVGLLDQLTRYGWQANRRFTRCSGEGCPTGERSRSDRVTFLADRGIVVPLYFVYIVRCADGSLYTGYARDPSSREDVHNSGRGARYTAGRRPVRLVYSEALQSAGEALKREHQLKQLSRAKKEALIARDQVGLKRL